MEKHSKSSPPHNQQDRHTAIDIPSSPTTTGNSRVSWTSTYIFPNRAVTSKAPSPDPSDQKTRRSNAEPGELPPVSSPSSSNSFREKASFIRSRTKSRLLDQQEEKHPRSQSQRCGKSHLSGKGTSTTEFDDDDPFIDDDLPDEYKKMKYNTLSLIQLFCLVSIIVALVCSVTVERLRKHSFVGLRLWKWEFMLLVVVSGRLVSGWAVRIIVLLIEGNFLLRKRVLYFIYGLKSSVQNCVWLALVWIVWHIIFDKKIKKVAITQVLSYVSKIWVCLLVGTLIWLLKTLVVKVLSSSFHVNTFFDRIQGALFHQYVIQTLSGAPLSEIEQQNGELLVEVRKLESVGAAIPSNLKSRMFPQSPKKDNRNGISIDELHRLNQKNISAWNMKRLMKIVRNSTIDEKLQGCGDGDETMVHITSEKQAKLAATKIFLNVAKPGAKHIYLEDLLLFMGDTEALRTLVLFVDGTEEKGISKRALKNLLVSAFRERRALALSLNDTKTAFNKLHSMLNVVVGILIVVVWLLVLKFATTHLLVFLSSQVLLVVFMFGNTCKTTFEAIIFMFVMHPFDVGDRVEVEGVQMVVEEMNILTTVFLKSDNQKIYYPNSILCTKPISNYYRSPDMGDAINFCIHISTPGEKIAAMKERITKYVNFRSDHWYPSPMIVLTDVEELNKLQFSVWLSHKMNHQDMGERWTRRSHLVEEMVKTFRHLEIEYRVLPLCINVHNISSTREPSTWTSDPI